DHVRPELTDDPPHAVSDRDVHPERIRRAADAGSKEIKRIRRADLVPDSVERSGPVQAVVPWLPRDRGDDADLPVLLQRFELLEVEDAPVRLPYVREQVGDRKDSHGR